MMAAKAPDWSLLQILHDALRPAMIAWSLRYEEATGFWRIETDPLGAEPAWHGDATVFALAIEYALDFHGMKDAAHAVRARQQAERPGNENLDSPTEAKLDGAARSAPVPGGRGRD